MKLSKNVITKAFMLATKKPNISRYELGELLELTDSESRWLRIALDNKDLFRFEVESFEPVSKEFIFCDLHKPFTDEVFEEVLFDEIKKANPEVITILGDNMDNHEISFFRHIRIYTTEEEIASNVRFLRKLREAFPDQTIDYVEGNHELRLQNYILDNAPKLQEVLRNLVEEQLKLKELNISYIIAPYKRGKLWHAHGHELGIRSANLEYLGNAIWKKTHDNIVVGHWHRQDDRHYKDINDNFYRAAVIGCGVKRMDYAPVNNWTEGFAIVDYDDQGRFRLHNHQVIDGEVY